MLHGYLSRVYTDLLSVSAEMVREITFSWRSSSGITLLYLLFKPAAFKWDPAALRPASQQNETSEVAQIFLLIATETEVQVHRLDHPDSLEKKCQARILLYEILITCKGEPKFFPFQFFIIQLEPDYTCVTTKGKLGAQQDRYENEAPKCPTFIVMLK